MGMGMCLPQLGQLEPLRADLPRSSASPQAEEVLSQEGSMFRRLILTPTTAKPSVCAYGFLPLCPSTGTMLRGLLNQFFNSDFRTICNLNSDGLEN